MIHIPPPRSELHTFLQKWPDMSGPVLRIIAGLCLIVTPFFVYALNEIDGQQLHDANCMSCHTTDIYMRADRIVNNFRQLEERVSQCELANELIWFDEEIDAVITYLNANFYHFDNQ
jgi:hypothetical protein